MKNAPVDILACIFPYTAGGSLLTAIRLSHVCRMWRYVALSLSELWCSFDYSLGVWIAKLQMGRISSLTPISISITLWDLELYSNSASTHRHQCRRIRDWLQSTQIDQHPRWEALRLNVSGYINGENGPAELFDLLSHRKDRLKVLDVRISQHDFSMLAAQATIMKLQFRPQRFYLEGLRFPATSLEGPYKDLEELRYGGGYVPSRSSQVAIIADDDEMAIRLPRLSTASFDNVNLLPLLTCAIAPSLLSLSLHNTFYSARHDDLLKLSAFAPRLASLHIYADTKKLYNVFSHTPYIPSLLILDIEQYGGGISDRSFEFISSLSCQDSFPNLKHLTLRYIVMRPEPLRKLLHNLPSTTTIVTLFNCLNARAPIQTTPLPFDLQIVFTDDTGKEDEWIYDSEEDISSEDGDWDAHSESESNGSRSTFASGESDFRVGIYKHERLALGSRLTGEDSSNGEMETDEAGG